MKKIYLEYYYSILGPNWCSKIEKSKRVMLFLYGYVTLEMLPLRFSPVLYTNILNTYLNFKHEHLYMYMSSENTLYGQMSSYAEFQLPITFQTYEVEILLQI